MTAAATMLVEAAALMMVVGVLLTTSILLIQPIVCLSLDNSDSSSSSSEGAIIDKTRRLRHEQQQYDPLFITRCKAHCWAVTNHRSSSINSKCMKTCFVRQTEKPGYCPGNQTNLPPFATACLQECFEDFQCAALLKCCQHSCGVTCQPPDGLATVIGLPGIPHDLKIERRKKRNIYIEWKPGGRPLRHVFYHIEARHHSGRNFIERKLNDWTLCGRTVNTSHLLKNYMKPGRWYQFRVAAVNGNGTRGFSEHVFTFSPKVPKAPRNISIGPLVLRNGSVNVRINWSPPVTDWPIQKYKVYWSRRLHGVTALDSVLVKQQVVPKDQTVFVLKDLEPNSQYFLQVQAFAQFGKDRLKGEKSGLVLNTTVNETIRTQNRFAIEDLQLASVYWMDGNLTARIVWKTKNDSMRYTINWWIGSCGGLQRSYTHVGSVTVKASAFNLFNLQFNCRYRVSIKEVNTDGVKFVQDTSINFTTQDCGTYTTEINCK